MLKPFVCVSILLAACIIQPFAAAAFVESDCFQDYEFSTGIQWTDFHPDMVSYSPGDEAVFSYTVKSTMAAPIVEGRERVQIFYNHPQREEELLDEFFVPGSLNFMNGDLARREFSWKIPAGAPAGTYTAKIYFIVGGMFNLAGLSIVPYGPPGVPGETTSFEVNGENESYIFFDKSETTLADETYAFSDFVPILETGYPALRTSVGSMGGSKDVKVTMETYAWDDLSGSPLKTENRAVIVADDKPAALEFNIPALNPNAYEIRLVATSGGEKAMLKVRFGVSGSRGRFAYAGITKFPLAPGESAGAFMCMSNAADHENWFNGSGTFRVVDEGGAVIFEEHFGPTEIPPNPYGLAATFTPAKSMTKGYVEVTMADADGKTVDAQRLEYDLSKFTNIGASLAFDADDAVSVDEEVGYTIKLSATRGTPISGSVLIYLIGDDGTVLQADELAVNGTYSGSIKPPGAGAYVLKVRETERGLEAERDITVSSGTAGGVRDATDYMWIWYALAVAAAAIAIFIFYRKFSV